MWAFLVITVYKYQGSWQRELSLSGRVWLPPLQTHFTGCVNTAVRAAPRILPRKKQRWPSAHGTDSVAQSLPLSSKKKSMSLKRLFSTPNSPGPTVPAVPELGYWFLGCGTSWKETWTGTDTWEWWRAGVGQFQCFEPPQMLGTQKSCSTGSNVCSYHFPSQPGPQGDL